MHKVFIHTDASFSLKSGIASYAYYIETPFGIISRSGIIIEKCENALHAEMSAIIIAVQHWLGTTPYTGDSVMICTDSQNAIHFFKKDKEMLKKYNLFDPVAFHKAGFIKNVGIHTGISFSFRHVKSHEDLLDDKFRLRNDSLDKEAKRVLINATKKAGLEKPAQKAESLYPSEAR
jgi:ribonuclease HI